MIYYRGWLAAVVSYRLGMADGVSVTAAQWVAALRELGMTVRTVAGDGRADVLVDGLGLADQRAPSAVALGAALDDVDLVVVDNVCSLPLNPRAGQALAAYLAGRRAILRHHDLPWERPELADIPDWPPDDPSWRHVTINEVARRSLERRGVAATTVYHGFEVGPTPRRKRVRRVRRVLGVEPHDTLVLQPTRAIARKNVGTGLAFAHALDGVYWLTGPAEDGYAEQLTALLAGSNGRVCRRLPPGVDMDEAYAACDLVVLPSSWEGFGLPLIEAALHRRPIAVGRFPVADELAAFGFRWFDSEDPEPMRRWLADPDPALLDHNEAIAREHFGMAALCRRLDGLLGRDWQPTRPSANISAAAATGTAATGTAACAGAKGYFSDGTD